MILGSDLPKVPDSNSFSFFFSKMNYKVKFYQKEKSFMKRWNTVLAHKLKHCMSKNNNL